MLKYCVSYQFTLLADYQLQEQINQMQFKICLFVRNGAFHFQTEVGRAKV